jgi:hypothetical protein
MSVHLQMFSFHDKTQQPVLQAIKSLTCPPPKCKGGKGPHNDQPQVLLHSREGRHGSNTANEEEIAEVKANVVKSNSLHPRGALQTTIKQPWRKSCIHALNFPALRQDSVVWAFWAYDPCDPAGASHQLADQPLTSVFVTQVTHSADSKEYLYQPSGAVNPVMRC